MAWHLQQHFTPVIVFLSLCVKTDITNELPDNQLEEAHCAGSSSISDFHVTTASHNTMAASYPSLLHIAPLPSVNSSAVSLLDDYDGSKPQTCVSHGGRRRISIAVIIPGILIFIASARLASALLIWLQSRHVESHIPHEDQYFKNALVAIEGATAPHKLDDGSLESDTTMYGDEPRLPWQRQHPKL